MNAEAAANLITDDEENNTIDEITLQNGSSITKSYQITSGEPFKVTICWTDAPGNVPPASLNPRTPIIINDLDLRIVDQNGTTYYPYKLNPNTPSAAATTNSKNAVDNVEQVYISAPTSGNYSVIIDHAGTLNGGNQLFSFIVSGNFTTAPEAPAQPTNIAPQNGATGISNSTVLSWQLGDNTDEYQLLYGTGVSNPTQVLVDWTSSLASSYNLNNLTAGTTYKWQVKARNENGSSEGPIWTFSTSLSAPTNLQGNTQIFQGENLVLSWSHPQGNDLLGFNIYRNNTKLNSAPFSGLSYTDSPNYNMNNGYAYKVSAVYDSGESTFSNILTVFVSGNGSISGNITNDNGGAALSGATINFDGVDEFGSNVSQNFQSNLSGNYSGDIKAGTYTITVTKENFNPVSLLNITLEFSETLEHDFSLAPSECEAANNLRGEYSWNYNNGQPLMGALISWQAPEDNGSLENFIVYRKTESNQYHIIGTVANNDNQTDYEYFDQDVNTQNTYLYQVYAHYQYNHETCTSDAALSADDPNSDFVSILITNSDEFHAENTKIYPNPTSSELTVEANNMNRVVITTVDGRIVYDKILKSDKETIPVSAWNNGLYLIRIQSNTAVTTKCFVITK